MITDDMKRRMHNGSATTAEVTTIVLRFGVDAYASLEQIDKISADVSKTAAEREEQIMAKAKLLMTEAHDLMTLARDNYAEVLPTLAVVAEAAIYKQAYMSAVLRAGSSGNIAPILVSTTKQ